MDSCNKPICRKELLGHLNNAIRNLHLADRVFVWRRLLRAGYDIVGYERYKRLFDKSFPIVSEDNSQERLNRVMNEIYDYLKPYCEVRG